MFKIPFKLTPASWGLKGAAYDVAEAHYSLTGEELQRRLIDLAHANDPALHALKSLELDYEYKKIGAYDYDTRMLALRGENTDQRKVLEVELKHGRISAYDHDVKRAALDFPEGVERELAFLEVERAYEKIAEKDYDKKSATLRQQPWIGIVNDGFDLAQGLNGVYFEFDWNEFWIEYLRLNGYGGTSEEDIVQQWFQDVCRTTIAEQAENGEFDPFNQHNLNARMDRDDI